MVNINKKIFIDQRISNWRRVAENSNKMNIGSYYHQYLAHIFRMLVPPNLTVLEIGCGKGDLIAALEPRTGIGVDFCSDFIRSAQKQHPAYQFICAEACEVDIKQKIDVIILSDILNDLWNVQDFFRKMKEWCHAETRIIINAYSRLWQPPMDFAQKIGLATRMLPQSWLTKEDISNLLQIEEFEIIKHFSEIICPVKLPLLSTLLNRYIAKITPFKWFALTNFIIARPINCSLPSKMNVSVIVPARNEEGNIKQIFDRIPQMGKGTELIFVEGGSKDNTYQKIEEDISNYPEIKAKLFRQSGKGKGDAVRLGIGKATGDIIMILDADLTVMPEDLPKFYNALVEGKGEFINGVRLVYPMEERAMRFFNLVGNKIFSLIMYWLLEVPIKDTLCGTKAFTKENYEKIARNRPFFGDFDPFGDFDLIFGAAKLNLKIIDLPIRYQERKYGETNISRWAHGWLLLKMMFFAARRLKFV